MGTDWTIQIIFCIMVIGIIGSNSAFAADESDTIYSNGDTGGSELCWSIDGWPLANPGQSAADDFVLDSESILTDIHFDTCFGGIPEFNVIIYSDGGGIPGNVIKETTSMNLEVETDENFVSRYWFDLVDPVPLDSGITYWLEINSQGGPKTGWLPVNIVTGNAAAFRVTPNWINIDEDLNFVLTSSQFIPVGGKIIPLDTTTLLLAGAQMTTSWIIPVIVAGTGFVIIIRRR